MSQPLPEIGPRTTVPTAGMTIKQVSKQAKPDPRAMASLGGIYAASNSDLGQPIPVPKTIFQLPSESSKHPMIDVQQDFDGPPSPAANPILKIAHKYLATPYLHGGADPRKGFDSVRFNQFLFSHEGIHMPATAVAQSNAGQQIRTTEDLKAGDLVFLGSGVGTKFQDIGIALGGGQFLHAPAGSTIKISSWSDPYYRARFIKGTRIAASQSQSSPTAPPPAGNSANYVARQPQTAGVPNAPQDPSPATVTPRPAPPAPQLPTAPQANLPTLTPGQ